MRSVVPWLIRTMVNSQGSLVQSRIASIDVLRGVAVLGILLMNVIVFGMPSNAYFDPTVFGGDEWLNHFIYSIMHVIVDQKFMAIFSMLFGASVILLTERREKPLKHHLIRNFWLFIFGGAHFILLWYGDILQLYAILAVPLYFVRNFPSRVLFVLGMVVFFLPVKYALLEQEELAHYDEKTKAELSTRWQPTEEEYQWEIDLVLGSYVEQVYNRFAEYEDEIETPSKAESSPNDNTLNRAVKFKKLYFLGNYVSRAFGMMLIGMALYRWGILTAQRTREFYRIWLISAFSIGAIFVLIGLGFLYKNDWHWSYAMYIGRIPNLVATPLIAFSWVALVMLWCMSHVAVGLRDRLAATGRMALTNYIGQSLIASFIFYGFGLGLFATMNRAELVIIVVLIWVLQVNFSYWWLKRFRYGPLEWLWRTLTYFKWQSIRKKGITNS